MLISDLFLVLAAESGHGGKSVNKEARRDMISGIEILTEERFQRTRDMAGLDQIRGPNHAPDPDQKTINVVGLRPNHGPDPEKGRKPSHKCSSHLSPPRTRGSRRLNTAGDTGLDPAPEREGKKK